ncbi:hypothetical protein GEMRC1_011465 [Eukaryota sp. GEM-RC1]
MGNSHEDWIFHDLKFYFSNMMFLQFLPNQLQSTPSQSLSLDDPFRSVDLMNHLQLIKSSFSWMKIPKVPMEVFFLRDCILFPVLNMYHSLISCITSSTAVSEQSLSVQLSTLYSTLTLLRNLTSVPGTGTSVALFLAYLTPNHLIDYEPAIRGKSGDHFSSKKLMDLLACGSCPSANQRFCLLDCVGLSLKLLPVSSQCRLFSIISELDFNILQHLKNPETGQPLAWVPDLRFRHSSSTVHNLLGLGSFHPTERLIAALMSGEFVPPELCNHFLNFEDYTRRLCVLNRVSLACSAVEGLRSLLVNQDDVIDDLSSSGAVFGPCKVTNQSNHQFSVSVVVSENFKNWIKSGHDFAYALFIKFDQTTDSHQLKNAKISLFRGAFTVKHSFSISVSQLKTATFDLPQMTAEVGSKYFQLTFSIIIDDFFLKPSEFPYDPLSSSSERVGHDVLDFDCVYFPSSHIGAHFELLKSLSVIKKNECKVDQWVQNMILGRSSISDLYLPIELIDDITLNVSLSDWEIIRCLHKLKLPSFFKDFKYFYDFSTANSIVFSIGGKNITIKSHDVIGTAFNPYFHQQLALFSSIFFKFSIIIGPPGTGKTQTASLIVENAYSTLQNLKKDEKIVVLSHSNLAIDNIIEKLLSNQICNADCMLRIGAQTTSPIVNQITFKGKIEMLNEFCSSFFHKLKNLNCDNFGFIDQCLEALSCENFKFLSGKSTSVYKELEVYLNDLKDNQSEYSKFVQIFDDQSSPPSLFTQFKTTFDNLLTLTKMKSVTRKHLIIKNSQIITGTVNSIILQLPLLSNYSFNLLVVEEASTITEPELLPLFSLLFKRIVLIGDDRQLRPYVPSPLAV